MPILNNREQNDNGRHDSNSLEPTIRLEMVGCVKIIAITRKGIGA